MANKTIKVLDFIEKFGNCVILDIVDELRNDPEFSKMEDGRRYRDVGKAIYTLSKTDRISRISHGKYKFVSRTPTVKKRRSYAKGYDDFDPI